MFSSRRYAIPAAAVLVWTALLAGSLSSALAADPAPAPGHTSHPSPGVARQLER